MSSETEIETEIETETETEQRGRGLFCWIVSICIFLCVMTYTLFQMLSYIELQSQTSHVGIYDIGSVENTTNVDLRKYPTSTTALPTSYNPTLNPSKRKQVIKQDDSLLLLILMLTMRRENDTDYLTSTFNSYKPLINTISNGYNGLYKHKIKMILMNNGEPNQFQPHLIYNKLKKQYSNNSYYIFAQNEILSKVQYNLTQLDDYIIFHRNSMRTRHNKVNQTLDIIDSMIYIHFQYPNNNATNYVMFAEDDRTINQKGIQSILRVIIPDNNQEYNKFKNQPAIQIGTGINGLIYNYPSALMDCRRYFQKTYLTLPYDHLLGKWPLRSKSIYMKTPLCGKNCFSHIGLKVSTEGIRNRANLLGSGHFPEFSTNSISTND